MPKATREAAGAKAQLRKARPVATERSGRVRPKNKKEVKKMARPRNKADLIVAATENFEKLAKMIE